MATQVSEARGRRDRRLVVLVSDKEKNQIETRARAADMSVSDWLRTAGEQFEMPTEDEKEQLIEVFRRIAASNRRLDERLERLDRLEGEWASFDEVAFRQNVEDKLAKENGDVDWVMFADMLGLRPKASA